jgi:hypothetical protein
VGEAESEEEVRVRGTFKMPAPLKVFEKAVIGSNDANIFCSELAIETASWLGSGGI